MHPALRLRATKSTFLKGRRVVLGVCGSIAAVESVKIAHELIRHGADVVAAMTPAATSIVTPLALEYATGHAPILKLSGAGEHVALMDGPRRADCLLLAPATANTIAKVSLGIDDSALTSFATVALGSGVPLVIAPAMHEVMSKNPAVTQRLKDLEAMGATIVPSRVEEGKSKLATPEDIADHVVHRLATGRWKDRRVLVISGSTAEPVDPVRVLTNRSSGRMGVELALALHRSGARVTLWNAWGSVAIPSFMETRRFQTVRELTQLCDRASFADFDAIFVPAALSDFAPRAAKHKLSSDAGPMDLKLDPLPKVIKTLRRRARKAVLVGFKAESDPRQLLARARQRLKEYGTQLMVANTTQAFAAESATVWLVAAKGKPRKVSGPKSDVARRIIEAAAPHLAS